MFRQVNDSTGSVEIQIDDETLAVPAGMTVAAVLLLHDRLPTRLNQATGQPRAPHCLMGACFECLLEIDGIEQRACQVIIEPGMRIRRRLYPEASEQTE